MNANLQAALAVETNVDALRGLVLIADAVIENQANELDAARDILGILSEELADSDVDADRYQLLKRSLREMLVIAAYTGAQAGHRAVEAFKQFDASMLDDHLDTLIEAGVLDALIDAEEDEQDGQEEAVGYAAAGPAYTEELLPQGVL